MVVPMPIRSTDMLKISQVPRRKNGVQMYCTQVIVEVSQFLCSFPFLVTARRSLLYASRSQSAAVTRQLGTIVSGDVRQPESAKLATRDQHSVRLLHDRCECGSCPQTRYNAPRLPFFLLRNDFNERSFLVQILEVRYDNGLKHNH